MVGDSSGVGESPKSLVWLQGPEAQLDKLGNRIGLVVISG